VAGVVAVALVSGLAWAWWPEPGAYRPIQAYERGALQDALPAGLRSATPGGLSDGGVGSARAVWPEGAELPTADAPALAVVMVPREPESPGSTAPSSGEGTPGAEPAPTWVFPFDRPLPSGEGDNQALAVNTTDGGTLYDVAFALVYADEGTVLNTNEAYALSSCTGCQTVAVAFQVVLVLGEANVVVPQNLSAAVNYACVQCVTYALATQLVLTVSGPLGADTTARLEQLWKELEAFGRSIKDLPLSQIQARLTEFESQILAVVRSDPAFVPMSTAPTTTATTTAPPSGAESTASPTGTSTLGGGSPQPSPPASASATAPASTQDEATQNPAPATTQAPEATTTAAPATAQPTGPAEPAVTSTTSPATTAP
jgi:putative peptide zinc metalloprotease protein